MTFTRAMTAGTVPNSCSTEYPGSSEVDIVEKAPVSDLIYRFSSHIRIAFAGSGS